MLGSRPAASPPRPSGRPSVPFSGGRKPNSRLDRATLPCAEGRPVCLPPSKSPLGPTLCTACFQDRFALAPPQLIPPIVVSMALSCLLSSSSSPTSTLSLAERLACFVSLTARFGLSSRTTPSLLLFCAILVCHEGVCQLLSLLCGGPSFTDAGSPLTRSVFQHLPHE
jgi:hypothetical protein